MKTNNKMRGCLENRHFLVRSLSLIAIIFLSLISLNAQDEAVPPPVDKPVRATFQSAWLIDNQSVMVPIKGTFEFDIMHRFGTLGKGYEDLYGFYASSNMRLGFSYAPIEKLSLGLGLTKRKHVLDFNAKYSILEQTRSDKIPVSITYFGNMAVDTRAVENREVVYNKSDRYSYFHQIIFARKFSDRLSLQVSGNLSHYNLIQDNMNNDHISASLGGKYGISDISSIIFNYDQPITKHKSNNPNPNLSLGIEVATSAHAFQVFVGNYASILPQENNVFNSNNYDAADGETIWDNFLIGFNITRLWNY